MRMGTQTLIQALQALPWVDLDNDDEGSSHEQDAAESQSEDEDTNKGQYQSKLIKLGAKPTPS